MKGFPLLKKGSRENFLDIFKKSPSVKEEFVTHN